MADTMQMLDPRPWDRPVFLSRIRTESLGGGSALGLAGGEVSARLNAIAIDRRAGRAAYELRVDNGTALHVAAFAYPLGETAGAIDWHAGTVPPFGAIAVRLLLPYDPRRSIGAVAQVFSSEASLTLEALAPRPARRSTASRALAAVAAIGTLAAGDAAATAMRPSIVVLAAPDRVTMGRAFEVAYAAAATDDVTYAVRTPDGVVVRRGSTSGSSGSFALDLPLTALGAAYDVEVAAATTFGSDRRSVRIEAEPPPADGGRAARIDAFALAADTARGGEPIVVTYRTAARAGTIELLDQAGTERASALLSRAGRSTLIAPLVDRDQDFRVVMTSRAGRTATDTAAAPVRVLAASAAPPGAGVAPSETVPALRVDGPSIAGPNVRDATVDGPIVRVPIVGGPIVRGPIGLASRVVTAGHAFVIRVLRPEPGLRLAVDDADGTELAEMRPPRGATGVRMRAPALPATYTLVATFASGLGQDSVVVPLRVTSAAPR